jgi:hypothetical protein
LAVTLTSKFNNHVFRKTSIKNMLKRKKNKNNKEIGNGEKNGLKISLNSLPEWNKTQVTLFD